MKKKKVDKDLPGYLQGWIPSKAVRSQLSPHRAVLSVPEDLLGRHRIDGRRHLMFLDNYERFFEVVVRHYVFEP